MWEKIPRVTVFNSSLLLHCIIQETNCSHVHALVEEEACLFHATSLVTFQAEHGHNHPNIHRCATKRGHSYTITDFTNSADGRSETLFHCLKDREQTQPLRLRHPPPQLPTADSTKPQPLETSFDFITTATRETVPLIK